ncbi:hypothetical protein ALC60_08584, partial [Trachymyrmex zeteki]
FHKEHFRHMLFYGDVAPSIKTREYWFRRFKSGDFNVNDKDRSRQLIVYMIWENLQRRKMDSSLIISCQKNGKKL